MKESLKTVFFLHLARSYASFALRTSSRTESEDPKDQGRKPHKNAKIGNFDPIADPNWDNEHRNAAKLKPHRQIRVFFDRIIPPSLILFANVCGLGLQLENDPFHYDGVNDAQRKNSAVAGQAPKVVALQVT